MSNINVTEGSGKTVATETISTVEYQKVKIVDGTASSTNAWVVNTDGSAKVSVVGVISASIAGGNISASIIGTVPVTPSNFVISGSVLTTFAPAASLVSGSPSVITGTTSVLVLAAPTGTQRNYITQILITNAASASATVNVVDNGQVIYSGFAAGSGGGFSVSFPTPLRQPTSALGLFVAASAAASIIAAISGYTAN